jgi:hypothetical protein
MLLEFILLYFLIALGLACYGFITAIGGYAASPNLPLEIGLLMGFVGTLAKII